MKIALFIKEELQETDIATYIISKISEHNFDIDQENPNFVLFIGGDGTFLRAVNEYIDQVDEIKFVGINEGSLGFFTDYVIDELDTLLNDLENGHYNTCSHRLLEAEISDRIIYAVNEIRLENPFHTLISKVFINGVLLETFRGNGLCISANAGSTAYNRSLGGAIIATESNNLQLTEMASINNRIYQSLKSPIILGEDSEIVLEGDFNNAVFAYDYLTTKEDTNCIAVRLSLHEVTYIYKQEHSFIDKIRDSLIK